MEGFLTASANVLSVGSAGTTSTPVDKMFCRRHDKVLDSRLSLREASRIYVGVTRMISFSATESQQALREGPVGEAYMELSEFLRAIFHCGNVKTWDGMCPVPQVRLACAGLSWFNV